ncbi:MAG: TlpA family protein disulfide reductase, partial [Acidobacteriales bacterium]|nr:TlpA family protein disulfide reductase [Terriglobales bacterium]
KLHWVGIQKISGKAYSVVTVKSANPMPYEATLFFSQDGVLERSTVRVVYSSSRTTTFDAQLSNIQINPSISRSSFLIAPTPNTMLETKHPKSDILDIGDLVPEFRLPTETGVDWSLLKERKHAKLTLINFWYLNCAPCMLEFPDLEKLYQQAHARGFNIVAIDKSDSATAIAKYAQRAHLTFPLVMGGEERRGSIFQRYHVSAFPTSYLIDAKGRIVWRSLGPNSEDLRAELIKRGMLNN